MRSEMFPIRCALDLCGSGGFNRNMHLKNFLAMALVGAISLSAAEKELPGVGAAMEEMIAKNEIAGAVTVVASKDKILHLETHGFADVASKKPMAPDTLFWIASM